MSTVEQQRRPNGPATITGIALFVVGLILLFNGVPSLFGVIGNTAQWAALYGIDRALEINVPFLILPGGLTIAGLLMLRGGFTMLRRQGAKGARWAKSEWQEHGGDVQQRFQSAREQLQSQGGSAWQQVQQGGRAGQQQSGWSPQQQAAANQQQRQSANQQRQGWPGQPQGQQRQPAPPQPNQRMQQAQQPPRQQSALERMQQRMTEASSAADRARDAAMAKHEQQAAALQQRAERAAAHVLPQYAEPGVSFGSPELIGGRRASSILASSSLRSTSLSRTSLSLDSLRLRR